MLTIKAHFDGRTIVFDEPVTLEAGQAVQIVVNPTPESGSSMRRPLAGFAKGTFEMREDFNDPLPEFSDYR